MRIPLSVIIRSHIPATLIVLSSFVGFFICHSKVPGRVALAITCFLAMVTLGLALRAPGGQADSVITAVDIYQIGCITFIFATLIEFALVHYIATAKKSGSKANTEPFPGAITKTNPIYTEQDDDATLKSYKPVHPDTGLGSNPGDVHGIEQAQPNAREDSETDQINNAGDVHEHQQLRDIVEAISSLETVVQSLHPQPSSKGHRIDRISQILFPFLFAMFNVLYWVIWKHNSAAY